MIVDSSNSGPGRVLLASHVDGSIINPNFIVDTNLQTPVSAIDSGRGTIFISDALSNQIREYSLSGSFMQTIVQNTQISGPRGIDIYNNGLFVTTSSGTFQNTIQRFDLTTGAQTTFITNANLGSPWDIAFRATDVLVSDGTLNGIRQFDLSGNFIGNFTGAVAYSSPRQITVTPSGEVLLARSVGGGGVSRFSSTGTPLGGIGLGPSAGAYQLENGNYIYGAGINLVLNTAPLSDTPLLTVSTASFRQIEFIAAVPEPSSIMLVSLVLVGLTSIAKSRRPKSLPAEIRSAQNF
jgi:hypothetical protein